MSDEMIAELLDVALDEAELKAEQKRMRNKTEGDTRINDAYYNESNTTRRGSHPDATESFEQDHSRGKHHSSRYGHNSSRAEHDARYTDRDRRGGGHHQDRYNSKDEADAKGGVKNGSDKGSANGSVRSRGRDRSVSPRRESTRYREREPLRSEREPLRSEREPLRSERDGFGRDRERGNHYRGHGPHSDHYRPGSSGGRSNGSHDEPRDHGRDRRDPHRDEDRNRRNGGRNSSPKPMQEDQDKRTVFVQQIPANAKKRHLEKFFLAAGEVEDAVMVKDKTSQRNKGIGYVTFYDIDAVDKAIAMTGQKLQGIPLIVSLTEAEKNRQKRTTSTNNKDIPFHRLYVGNIHFDVTEDDLRNVFGQLGELELVELQREPEGRSKGYGFLQYKEESPAKQALETMNGLELNGRQIRVGLGSDRFTADSTRAIAQRFGTGAQASFSGAGGRGAHAGGSANFDRASGRDQDKSGGASALDDTDVDGVNFSNYSRQHLMENLSRKTNTPTAVIPKPQQSAPVAEQESAPSRCVVIKNVFVLAEMLRENPTGWQEELMDDFKSECSAKYGAVEHLGIPPNTDDGEVYVKFANLDGGRKAILGLNGRKFGGRTISATYVVDRVFDMTIPAARR